MNSIESSVSQIKTEPSSRLETIVMRATYLPNASFVIEYDQQWLDIFHSFSNSREFARLFPVPYSLSFPHFSTKVLRNHF